MAYVNGGGTQLLVRRRVHLTLKVVSLQVLPFAAPNAARLSRGEKVEKKSLRKLKTAKAPHRSADAGELVLRGVVEPPPEIISFDAH